jgi:hypothetical protein
MPSTIPRFFIYPRIYTIINLFIYSLGGRNGVVDTATRYGLDGTGFEQRW